jgi:hypothetical protein
VAVDEQQREKRIELARRNLEKSDHGETHGFYKYLALDAANWPGPMKEMYDERRNELMTMNHIDPTRDAGAIAQICRLEVCLARLYAWLANKDLIAPDGQYQPILRVLAVYENSLARMYDRAGLNPESGRRLGAMVGSQDWANLLGGAEVAVDAEDEDGGKN